MIAIPLMEPPPNVSTVFAFAGRRFGHTRIRTRATMTRGHAR